VRAFSNARRLLAENIQVIALGDKKVPSIVIYDNGEGQHQTTSKTHSCHYTKSNKTNIHFIKVSTMGSTGAVTFCGDKSSNLLHQKKCAAKYCR
jgi:hypothetical protein